MTASRRVPAFGAWGLALILTLVINIVASGEDSISGSGFFASDPVGAFLQTPGWGNDASADSSGNGDGALQEKFLEVQSQMRKIDLDLAGLQRNWEQLENNNTTLKSKLGLSSETRFNSTLTPGNGATPSLYSVLRFNTPLAGKTNLYSELFLQGGAALGPLRITTQLDWQGRPYSLQMGRFWFKNTYFTIARAPREDDTWNETRCSWDGILLSARPWGLNWRGFLVRNVDGNGSKYDRYTLFSSMNSPIRGGEISLTFMKVFDDTKTAASGAAYESSTVGLSFRYRGQLLGRSLEANGESNVNRLDQDRNGGPFPSWEYAVRAEGKLWLKVPLKFNYYSISRDYPLANTAIQPLSSSFIWQYEENPYIPYYLSNLHYFELATVPIQLGEWGNWTVTGAYAKENTPTGKVEKRFSHGKLNCTANLGALLSAPLAKSAKMTGELDIYNTAARGELAVRQNVGRVSLIAQILPNVNIELGYQQFYLQDLLSDQPPQLQSVPFAIGSFNVFNSIFNWKYYPLFSQNSPVAHRHKLEWRTPVGPSTSLRLTYELSRSESVNQTQQLAVEYWSGF